MFHICVWMQISVGYLAYFIIGLLDSKSRALLGEETSLTWALYVIWVQAGNSRKEQVSERLLPSLLGRQGFSEATESRWELEVGDKLHVPQACGESYELPQLPRRHGPRHPSWSLRQSAVTVSAAPPRRSPRHTPVWYFCGRPSSPWNPEPSRCCLISHSRSLPSPSGELSSSIFSVCSSRFVFLWPRLSLALSDLSLVPSGSFEQLMIIVTKNT